MKREVVAILFVIGVMNAPLFAFGYSMPMSDVRWYVLSFPIFLIVGVEAVLWVLNRLAP